MEKNISSDIAIFIFHRDLRLEDNSALLEACRNAKCVWPIFIFDPDQLYNNPYRSDFLIRFMIESLDDLDDQLQRHGGQLYCFEGRSDDVLATLLAANKNIKSVYSNRDYTPFAIDRDLALAHVCKKSGVKWVQSDDALLNPPERILKNDGGVYTVYTPYYKKAQAIEVDQPRKYKPDHLFTGPLPNTLKEARLATLCPDPCDMAYAQGGRAEALKRLKKIDQLKNYHEDRNIPALDATTGLSAHNKFGTVSIREVYHYIVNQHGKDHTLIRELYWRDFFTQVGFHHPYVLGQAFQQKYDNIEWSQDEEHFERWCAGLTGFPIVDAGMRQLKATGYMHNRVRMIVASFLVKDLQIDWRWGERHFAHYLIDYDPFVNNGSWQWAASTGCDAQPYFRIFNPWLQQKRYDPDCEYIKQWVPELRSVPVKLIHEPDDYVLFSNTYPRPIIDHRRQVPLTKALFQNAR